MSRSLFQFSWMKARLVSSWLLLMVGMVLWVPPVYRMLSAQPTDSFITKDQQSDRVIPGNVMPDSVIIDRNDHNDFRQRVTD